MTKLREPLNGADSSIPMLLTAATVCVLFMLIAGGLVYGNTRRTITASEWVAHTQEVLNSLRTESQMSERVEYSAHLHELSGDAGRLDTARTSANNLQSGAEHIKVLVSDNNDEIGNAEQLTACSADVIKSLNHLDRGVELQSGPIERCQQVIGKMMEQERRFLAERTKTSQQTSMISLVSDFIFMGLSVLTLIVVFGFLLRAAEMRQRSENRILETNKNLEQNIQTMQERAQESDLLSASRDELQLCVNLQDVYQSAKTGFSRLLPKTSGALCMLTNSRNIMETVSSWGEVAIEDCHTPESCCGLRSGQPRWRQPDVSEIHCSHFVKDGPENYVCIPVVAHGDTLGLLYLECQDAEGVRLIQQHFAGVRQLVQLTGMAVASMKLRIKLENQSIRDPLTNLFNRHFMEVALDRELSRAVRRKSMIAVMMLDVDKFKDFNDVHGHAAGDTVLKAVAEVCQKTVRSEDIVCRYGGEEFTVILPDITAEAACERAENIRHAIVDLHVQGEKEFYGDVTMSIGIALFPDDGTTAEVLLRKADQALYRAKQQGRNQVLLFAEPTLVG